MKTSKLAIVAAILTAIFGLTAISATAQSRGISAGSPKAPKAKSAAEEKREFKHARKALAAVMAKQKKAHKDDGPEVMPMTFLGESESLEVISARQLPPMSKENGFRQDDDEGGNAALLLKSLAGPSSITAPLVQSFIQTDTPTPSAAIAGTSFEGPGAGIAGFPIAGIPPDTTMAVGPNHIVAWVNSSYMIFSKAGATLMGPTAGNALFAGLGAGSQCSLTNRGDPILQYDRIADRWILSQFAFNAAFTINSQCIAVSTTNSPLGTYNLYETSFGGDLPDYGKLGIWNDAYYMSFSRFFNGGAFVGDSLCAFDRTKMLAGLAATAICFPGTTSGVTGRFSFLPADLDGPTLPTDITRGGLFLGWTWPFTNTPPYALQILRLKPDFAIPGNSTLTNGFGGAAGTPFTIPLPASEIAACNDSGGSCIPQPGTAQTLDTLSDRPMYRLAYRNRGGTDSLVFSRSMDPDAAGAQRSALHWYEIRNPLGNVTVPASAPFLFQNSTYNPTTTANRWMGSGAMNGDGDMLFGYSIANITTGQKPSIAVAGRQNADAVNTLQAEQIAFTGTGSQTFNPGRWGDYSTMQVDPSDDKTFWYIAEYLTADGAFNWHTRIVSYKFPAAVGIATTTTITSHNPNPSNVGQVVLVTFTVTPAGPTGNVTVTDGVDSCVGTVAAGTCNITLTTAGVRTLTASYAGDAIFAGSSSPGVSHTVVLPANLALGTTTVTETLGNGDGQVGAGETARLAAQLINNGGVTASSIVATLTTSTAGVIISPPNTRTYPDIAGGGNAVSTTPWQFSLANNFVCGTPINFTLTVTYLGGTTPSQTFNFTKPTAGTSATVTTTLDATPPPANAAYTATTGTNQTGRLSRNAVASTCAAAKANPGLFDATPGRSYDAYTFTPLSSGCVTVSLTQTGVALFSLAYNNAGFVPASPATNYLADPGTSTSATPYSFNVTAGQPFTIVVHEVNLGAGIGQNYTLDVSGVLLVACSAPPAADLSITKTDGITSIPAGSSVNYTITASNAGPGSAIGATVTDTFPAAITNAPWTCASSGGATCGAFSGNGNISQVVNLPVGGSVTYTVAATISPSATGTLSNTATVTGPAGSFDGNTANNSATDVDTLTGPSVFVIDDVQRFEGQSGTTPFVFTVTKTGATGFATAVQFQTFDGTATVAGNDYVPTNGTLNFGPTEITKTITVLVNGDTNIEPNETFFVRLSNNPVNALIGDGEGQGLIQNDDPGATPTPTPIPTPTPTPPNRFEGDINRTAVGVSGTGDTDVNVADQIQYLRFFNGTDCPSANERPRLDAGPIATRGDGSFGAVDGTAIDAYARHDNATDFDPNTPGWQATPVGGPTTLANVTCTQPDAPEGAAKTAAPESAAASAARVVRVVSRSGSRNSDIMVDIEMTAQGNEAGTQFGLHFDPTVLSISDVSGVNVNPDISVGANAPAGTTLNVNAEDAANGNIGIVEIFNAAKANVAAIPEGATRIARVKFHVLDGAAAGSSRVTFGDSVISGVTSDVNGMVLSASYEGGSVSVTSSRGVTVSGRVTSSDGRGVRGAKVTIGDGDGFARTVTTSSFGYYTFDDVAAATYTIAVSSRQYRYASRTIDVADNLTDVNFTGLE